MMYEEAHHYRRRVRGDLADEADERFMRKHVNQREGEAEEYDKQEKEELRELNEELMDQNTLHEVMESSLRRKRPNRI